MEGRRGDDAMSDPMFTTSRIVGALQRGDESLPTHCTKCGHAWTQVSLREAHCSICGTTFYRLVGAYCPSTVGRRTRRKAKPDLDD